MIKNKQQALQKEATSTGSQHHIRPILVQPKGKQSMSNIPDSIFD